jgi:soluble lytic murein transglycosylase
VDEADARYRDLIARYPYNYFSYRAREVRPALASTPPANAAVPFPDLDAQLASLGDPRLAGVDELRAIGLTRDASREMKRIAAAYPDNLGVAYKLAETYVLGGEPAAANAVLQRRFRDLIRHGGADVPLRFWQILYPLSYWDDIRAEASKRSLDPYLVASIIRQESGFEPLVVSNAGAVGLMQIMPAEAGRIAAEAGIPGVTREKLFEPVTNIAVGSAEYSQKLAGAGGNPILAVAAYNAGEEAVGKWLARTPVDDVDVFVEAIPYAETRLYVKSVTRNRFEYRRIYEGSSTGSQTSQ